LTECFGRDAERGCDSGCFAAREGELSGLDLVPRKTDSKCFGFLGAEELEHSFELRALGRWWRLGVLCGSELLDVLVCELAWSAALNGELARRQASCDHGVEAENPASDAIAVGCSEPIREIIAGALPSCPIEHGAEGVAYEVGKRVVIAGTVSKRSCDDGGNVARVAAVHLLPRIASGLWLEVLQGHQAEQFSFRAFAELVEIKGLRLESLRAGRQRREVKARELVASRGWWWLYWSFCISCCPRH